MKKIVSLNVSDTNVYDKSSLEVWITTLCRSLLFENVTYGSMTQLGVLLFFPVNGVLVHCKIPPATFKGLPQQFSSTHLYTTNTTQIITQMTPNRP